MVKIIVLWGRPDDPEAFERRYVNEYLPVAREVPGVRLVELSTVLGSPRGGETAYYRVGEIWLGTREEAQASLASDAGQAWLAELDRLADALPVEVLMTEADLPSADEQDAA